MVISLKRQTYGSFVAVGQDSDGGADVFEETSRDAGKDEDEGKSGRTFI